MTTVQVESVRDVPLSGDFVEAVAFMVERFGATVKMPVVSDDDTMTYEDVEKELQGSFEGRAVKVSIRPAKAAFGRAVAASRLAAKMPTHPSLQPFAYFEPRGEP